MTVVWHVFFKKYQILLYEFLWCYLVWISANCCDIPLLLSLSILVRSCSLALFPFLLVHFAHVLLLNTLWLRIYRCIGHTRSACPSCSDFCCMWLHECNGCCTLGTLLSILQNGKSKLYRQICMFSVNGHVMLHHLSKRTYNPLLDFYIRHSPCGFCHQTCMFSRDRESLPSVYPQMNHPAYSRFSNVFSLRKTQSIVMFHEAYHLVSQCGFTRFFHVNIISDWLKCLLIVAEILDLVAFFHKQKSEIFRILITCCFMWITDATLGILSNTSKIHKPNFVTKLGSFPQMVAQFVWLLFASNAEVWSCFCTSQICNVSHAV